MSSCLGHPVPRHWVTEISGPQTHTKLIKFKRLPTLDPPTGWLLKLGSTYGGVRFHVRPGQQSQQNWQMFTISQYQDVSRSKIATSPEVEILTLQVHQSSIPGSWSKNTTQPFGRLDRQVGQSGDLPGLPGVSASRRSRRSSLSFSGRRQRCKKAARPRTIGPTCAPSGSEAHWDRDLGEKQGSKPPQGSIVFRCVREDGARLVCSFRSKRWLQNSTGSQFQP